MNREDSNGETPLMAAIHSQPDNLEAFQLLLQKSNSVEVNQSSNSARWTPLMSATYSGNTGIIRLLLERGDIELESKAMDGCTALALACDNCDVDTVQIFLGRGAELESLDNYGQTPLLRAVRAGNVGVVEALLEAGCMVDLADISGRTPLSIAAEIHKKEVARALIDRGADINSKDAEGVTPLMWFFMGMPTYRKRSVDTKDCFAFLLAQKNVDINWKAKDGSIARSIAFRFKYFSGFYEPEFFIETLEAHSAGADAVLPKDLMVPMGVYHESSDDENYYEASEYHEFEYPISLVHTLEVFR
ncbi:Similar to Ankyrin repeat domain-containing protein 50; acc. no. Q9ULJ7 [Pyronema omphalodes CBS 100304]|uniref:Similar to Ankyrin repeat domain-containing protein 50 acc. no. Q9ULJ7 n=1 Tax=Pyronema omphalodes (strain CBS 100304) TaxID=1076935 RepID=U4LVK9_PYROM|nr:Similar to Ankyrin repeat domain-containing protein 50; acc. no. Q9ULJ7 [Pyronema omphalodes CBS 100304]